ncbi:MAG: porin [Pseudomonadota bacterium]
MRRQKCGIMCLLLTIILVLPTAGKAFIFGQETKGIKIDVGEHTNLNIRFRIQPRLDLGDLTKNRDGSKYDSESDLYIRRARLEFDGYLFKNLKYVVHLSGDNWGKAGHDDEIELFYAYIDYRFFNELSFRAGKAKLPYSRVSLTSSAKQLLIERPVSTGAARKVFDDYFQPNLLVHGKFLKGLIDYNLACGDGWEEGKALRTDNTVRAADPLFVGRVELSLPGWVESKKSDAHLGEGRHLTLGVHYAIQNAIEYEENVYKEDRSLLGLDLSGHWKGITGQFEYNAWEIDFSDSAKKSQKPKGWYIQAGYFIKGINLEPAARYEEYDQDSSISDKKEKVWTVGANWYLKGHSLKISANWSHTKFEKEANGRLEKDDEKDTFQLQAQFYF